MSNIKYADLQINGFTGVDFSAPDLTADDFLRTAENIFKSGTYLFLPTVVTSSKEVYLRNLAIMHDAAAKHGLLDRIPGAHLEGPFISPVQGAVGAHPKEYVLEADIGFFDEIMERSNGFVKLMTVAAEKENMAQFISHVTASNVVVSCGHQMASSADLKNAADAGAVLLTHLGNGCPNMIDRHRNMIWSGMACDKLKAMIITDGHHLPQEVIKCIIRAKGVDNVIVTSDAAPIAGLPPGRYNCWGNDAVLEENGLFHNIEKGCLVGSSASMKDCADFLRTLDFLSEEDIIRMTSLNPLAVLNSNI